MVDHRASEDRWEGGGAFPATRWTALRGAGSEDPEERRSALEVLVAGYWRPVYKYLRLRWRRSDEDAQDLTQEFFARLIERGDLEKFDPEKARLRTYLRVCLDRLVQNTERNARRQKRGGSVELLPMDFVAAEAELALVAPPASDARDEVFEREWVRSLFGLAVDELRERCDTRGRSLDYRLFERYELGDESVARPTYAQLGEEFDVPVTRVTNRLAAVRGELRGIVLEKLREMTGSDEEFRSEARAVLGVKLK